MQFFLAAIRCGPRGWMLIGTLLIGTLVAAYSLTHTLARKSVTLTVGREVYYVNTYSDTVGAALNERGILINPEDRVVPALSAPLHDGDNITVQKAHPIAVSADGQMQHIRTQATHPLDVLASQHISFSPHDLIRVDGKTYSAATLQSRIWNDPVRTIFVLRGVSITVIDRDRTGEQVRSLYTTQTEVGRALDEAGFMLYLADRVTPGLSAPVKAGMVVEIERSMPLTVIADGRTLATRAVGPTVGDALASLELAPIDQDVIKPPEDTLLEPAMTIQIVRVTEQIVIEVEPIPFSTWFQFTFETACGELTTLHTGVDGELERRVRVRYEDGAAVERQMISERVIQEPMSRVVGCGGTQVYE